MTNDCAPIEQIARELAPLAFDYLKLHDKASIEAFHNAITEALRQACGQQPRYECGICMHSNSTLDGYYEHRRGHDYDEQPAVADEGFIRARAIRDYYLAIEHRFEKHQPTSGGWLEAFTQVQQAQLDMDSAPTPPVQQPDEGTKKMIEALGWCKWLFKQVEFKKILDDAKTIKWGDPEIIVKMVDDACPAAAPHPVRGGEQ